MKAARHLCPSCCPVCREHYVVLTLRQDCEAAHREALAKLAADITEDTPPDRVIRTR